MTLHSPHQEPVPQLQSIYIVNPSVKEFKTQILDDDNKTIEIILAPLETKEFSRPIGETILNHLANFILNEEGFSYKNSVKLEIANIKRRCIVHE